MTKDGKICYGIIGFGGIAENRVAKEGYACDTRRFQPLKNAKLVAATDINPARAEAAKALGLKFYKTADEMLADDSIDAVYVATNNATHAANAIRALEAGKHVIVEKPFTTKLEDARAILSLARKKHLSVSVDHMMVNNAYHILAKKYMKSGKLGEVKDACIHMEDGFGFTPQQAATWRCSKVAEMGGPIGDLASHCFYVTEFLFGSRIVGLSAVYYPKLMEMVVEDGAYIKAKLENGMFVSIRAAFNENRAGTMLNVVQNLGVEIYGDKGVVRTYGTMGQLSGHDDEPVRIRMDFETADGVKHPRPRSIVNIYRTIIETHAKSVIDGRPLVADGAVRNLKCCLAAHKSAKAHGKFIEIK